MSHSVYVILQKLAKMDECRFCLRLLRRLTNDEYIYVCMERGISCEAFLLIHIDAIESNWCVLGQIKPYKSKYISEREREIFLIGFGGGKLLRKKYR